MIAAPLLLAVALSSADPKNADADALIAAHRAEVEAFRAQRDARLRRPDGWLTLAGLVWLDEGSNSFGSDPANRIVLPSGIPGCMGELVLENGAVRVQTAPGIVMTSAGQPVTAAALRSDTDGTPTVLEYGHVSFFVIKRRDRFAVRVKNSRSPVLAAFGGLDAFPIAERWRIEGRFERYDPPREVLVPSVIGGADKEICPGAIVFEVKGATYRLEPVLEEGSEDLFIIFGDKTNGYETYGAGRFVYAKQPDQNGRVVIDFNKSYSPPCIFTPFATCPLPTPQNRLPIRVEAGEKTYVEHDH